MKKTFLLAGFFILTSTSQSFAKLTQQDTLPTTQNNYKLCNMDLRLNFVHWIQSQAGDSIFHMTRVDLRPQTLAQRDYNSTFHFNWWPQAIQLNNNLIKISNLNKTSTLNNKDYPLTGLAPDIYKWLGLHK